MTSPTPWSTPDYRGREEERGEVQLFVERSTRQHNMAIARPIRVLGLVAIGLWIFFIYQVWGPKKYPKGPGDTLENMDRDPNLDRMREPF